MDVRGRIRALWLLALFLLAQGGPVLAVGLADGMAGMACCKRGREACCKRKPMGAGTAMQAGHACAVCVGMPAAGGAEGVAAGPGFVESDWAAAGAVVLADRAEPVWAERGARFARPPPGLSFSLRT